MSIILAEFNFTKINNMFGIDILNVTLGDRNRSLFSILYINSCLFVEIFFIRVYNKDFF